MLKKKEIRPKIDSHQLTDKMCGSESRKFLKSLENKSDISWNFHEPVEKDEISLAILLRVVPEIGLSRMRRVNAISGSFSLSMLQHIERILGYIK